MNYLTTCIEAVTGRVYSVVWANGKSTQGRIRVIVQEDQPMAAVAAELGALHHLLVERAIYGTDRAGKNLTITTSSKEIRKLALSVAEEEVMSPLAGFLATRFTDAAFCCETTHEWLKQRADNDEQEVTLPSALDDYVNIRGIGRVALTRHFIEQYRKRTNWPEAYKAWQAVVLLSRGEFFEVPISEANAECYQERHGYVGRLLWSRTSKWMLVLSQRANEPLRIVTAYYVERRPRGATPVTDR